MPSRKTAAVYAPKKVDQALLSSLLVLVTLSSFIQAAQAACSATQTPTSATYNGSNGVIMSDSDGYGWRNYAANERCTWNVGCPSGTSFGIYEVDYRFSSNDELRIYAGSESTARKTYFSYGINNQLLLDGVTNVRVYFYSTSSYQNDGFTLRYMCMKNKCSSRTKNFDEWTDGLTYIYDAAQADPTTKMMTIKSDIDGEDMATVSASDGVPLPYEQCSWKIQCNRSVYDVAQIEVVATLDTQASISVALSDGTSKMAFNGGGSGPVTERLFIPFTSDTSTPAGSGLLDVAFSNGPISITSSKIYRGFTMKYKCLSSTTNGQCSSKTANAPGDSSSVISGANSGTISSDSDGDRSGSKYYGNEDCIWRVRCPSGRNYMALYAYGTLTTGDTLTITNTADNAQVYTKTNGFVSTSTMVASNGVDITFTSDASAEAAGFSIDYTCSTDRCSSLDNGKTFTGITGVINSDQDGYKPYTKYFANESCSWDIQCPSNAEQGIVLNVVGVINPEDTLLFSPLDASFTAKKVSTSRTKVMDPQTIELPGTKHMRVSFSPTAANSGFSISYRCLVAGRADIDVDSVCASPNSTLTTTYDQERLTGTIVSSGAGDQITERTAYVTDTPATQYFNNERCTWDIVCPAVDANGDSIRYILLVANSFLADSGDVLQYVSSVSPSVTGAFALGTVDGYKKAMASGKQTQLQFTTNSGFTSAGFALNYTCLHDRCTAPDSGRTFTDQLGTIQTDYDGIGTRSKYIANEYCQWNIRCPNNEQHVVFTVSTNTYNSADYLRAYDANGVLGLLFSQSSYKRDVNYVVDTGNVTVQFVTSSVSHDGGAQLSYNCTNSTCSTVQTHLDTGAESGTLKSDTDGVSYSGRIADGDRCIYSFKCPAGFSYAALRIRHRLYDGDSLVVRNGDQSSKTMLNSVGYVTKAMYVPLSSDNTVYFVLTDGTPSSSTTSNYQPAGFTVDYTCRNDPCSSQTPKLVSNGTDPSVLTAVIASDGDGDATSYTLSRQEYCSWYFTCPADAAEYAFLTIRHRLSSSGDVQWRSHFNTTSTADDVVSLISGGASSASISPQTRLAKFPSTNATFPSPTLRFELTSPWQVYTSDYGVDFAVTCSATRCQSSTSGQVLSTSSETSSYVYIYSDPDGSGSSSFTVPGEKCSWEMKCTKPGDRIEISNFVTRMHSTTVLSIFDNRPLNETVFNATSGAEFPRPRLLRQFTGITYESLSLLVLPTNHASIVFDVTSGGENRAGSGDDRGFSLRFRCVRTASCVSALPSPGTVLSNQNSGTVKSDRDGSLSLYQSLDDSWCSWGIVCPSSSSSLKYVKMDVSYSLPYASSSQNYEGESHIMFRSGGAAAAASSPFLVYYTSTSVQTKNYLLTSPVAIDFVTESAAANGFSIDYTCTESRCTSKNSSIQLSSKQTPLTPPVRIVTDEDGSGSTSVPLINELCDWRLKCPSAKPFMVFTARGTWVTGDVSFTYPDPAVEYEGDPIVVTPKAYTYTRQPGFFLGTTALSIVDLKFNISTPPSKSTPIYGATIDFDCAEHQCEASTESSTTFTAMVGTIYARKSSNADYTASNQKCVWYVRCPSYKSTGSATNGDMGYVLHVRTVFKLSGRTPSSSAGNGVYIEAMMNGNPVSSASHHYYSFLSATVIVPGNYDSVRVRFETDSDGISVTPPPSIQYTCEYEEPVTTPSPPGSRSTPSPLSDRFSSTESDGADTGTIVGATIGGLVFIGIVVGVSAFICVASKRNRATSGTTAMTGSPPPSTAPPPPPPPPPPASANGGGPLVGTATPSASTSGAVVGLVVGNSTGAPLNPVYGMNAGLQHHASPQGYLSPKKGGGGGVEPAIIHYQSPTSGNGASGAKQVDVFKHADSTPHSGDEEMREVDGGRQDTVEFNTVGGGGGGGDITAPGLYAPPGGVDPMMPPPMLYNPATYPPPPPSSGGSGGGGVTPAGSGPAPALNIQPLGAPPPPPPRGGGNGMY